MVELFYSFWWLLFPAAFLVAGAWNAWLAERRRAAIMQLLAHYAASGKEPPAELLRSLGRDATRDVSGVAQPAKG